MSFWVSVIPKLFIPREGVTPTLNPSREGSQEGWWVVCAGTEGRDGSRGGEEEAEEQATSLSRIS